MPQKTKVQSVVGKKVPLRADINVNTFIQV